MYFLFILDFPQLILHRVNTWR